MKPSVRLIIALILFVAVVFAGRYALSGAKATNAAVPEIGPHTPLIQVEKSENPQNLMVVYTRLDPKTCSFETKSGKPVLDEYWLMDGQRYKKVNPLIKNAVSERFQLDQSAFKSNGKFLVHLKDFHELKSDLGSSPTFEVTLAKAKTECAATVIMQLGESDHFRKIAIESIYADSHKTAFPPFRKLNSLTLKGKDIATGEAIHRTYSAQ